MKNKIILLLLLVILVGAFAARLYRFNSPVADWHSWRQADTASVTRSFVKEGFDPLYPKFNIYNSLNEGLVPNPNRYFFAEFPIYNIVHYLGYRYIGVLTLEEWGRLISIVASVFTVLALYLLVSIYSSKRAAILSALFFAILPFNVYYGRTILPDPLHVLFTVLTLYFASIWVRKGSYSFAVLAGLSFAGALLTKPYALVLLLPLGYLILDAWPTTFLRKWSIYVFGFVAMVPFLLWRYHINQHPEGMFATGWLFNEGNIRFTGAYFRWLIFDRMNRLIFATGGFVLFFMGLMTSLEKKGNRLYYFWLASILIFFVVIAKGNVTHDYYQLPLVPVGCVFMALGLDWLWSYGKNVYQKRLNFLIGLVLVALMMAFGWFEVRGYFNINNPAIVEAGRAVDQKLPKNAKVIAPYLNDSAFLYQTNRNGWTLGGVLIPRYIKEGAEYLVSVDFDNYTNFWIDHCTVVDRTSSYIIVNLKECKDVSNPPK